MTGIEKIKDEPIDDYEDPLRTLASAAIEHNPLPVSMQLQNEQVADSIQQKAAISGLSQAVKHEPTLTDSVPNCTPAQPMPGIAAFSPLWYDVGILRKPFCTIKDFYVTESSIDHRADTSDNIPDYAGLHKLSLLPGVAYKFRVAAINSCGIGDFSEVSAFKTCMPGYPGAPRSIRVSRSNEGVTLRWEPPVMQYGRIIEYSVCLSVKKQVLTDINANKVPLKEMNFVRVYCGVENCAFVENDSLEAAHVDRSVSTKPAIMFRIAARNEKGYGPATQVRWLF